MARVAAKAVPVPMFSGLVHDPVQKTLTFEISDIDLSYVSGLRRALLTDIPTVAVKFKPQDPSNPDVNFIVNTSSLHNEILGHRLSMVPVCTPDVDTYQRDDYRFVINKQNKEQEPVLVTTDDIRVYLSDSSLAPPAVHQQLFPRDPITGDPILLTKLKPNIYTKENGEALHVEFWASVGTAQENALWSPVSLATFSFTVDEDAATAALASHLQDYKAANPDATAEEMREVGADFNTLQRGRYYMKDALGNPSRFKFSMESTSGLSCTELVRRAWSVLRSHLQKILAAMPERVKVERQPNAVHLVFIEGAKHTHGSILQGYLHRHAGRLGVQFAGYHVPHPLEERVILKLVMREAEEEWSPEEALKGALEGACEELDDLRRAWEDTVK